jgi:hypothetical protein
MEKKKTKQNKTKEVDQKNIGAAQYRKKGKIWDLIHGLRRQT